MSDVPSNLPFDPLDEVDTVAPVRPMPPVPPPPAPRPSAPLSSLATDVAAPAPLPPRPAPPVPPSTPMPSLGPAADMFADVEIASPVKTSTRPTPAATAMPSRSLASDVMPPLPPAHDASRTWLIAGIVLALLLASVGGLWYGYTVWQERAMVASPVFQPDVETTELPILPPPAQDPTPQELFGNEVNTEPGELVPLPTPVTTPPEGTTIPSPTPIDPNAPIMPTAPMPDSGSTGVYSSSTTPMPQPALEFDTDGDGLTDARERELGTDPSKMDTDGDTVNDGAEVNTYGTNPLNPDTDGDGFPDGVEINNGFNPRGTGKCTDPSCRL